MVPAVFGIWECKIKGVTDSLLTLMLVLVLDHPRGRIAMITFPVGDGKRVALLCGWREASAERWEIKGERRYRERTEYVSGGGLVDCLASVRPVNNRLSGA